MDTGIWSLTLISLSLWRTETFLPFIWVCRNDRPLLPTKQKRAARWAARFVFYPRPRPRPPGCRPRRRRRSRRRSPPPSPQGYRPRRADWKVSSRRMRTGEEDRVSTPSEHPVRRGEAPELPVHQGQGSPQRIRHRPGQAPVQLRPGHSWAVGGPDGTRSLGGPLLQKVLHPLGRSQEAATPRLECRPLPLLLEAHPGQRSGHRRGSPPAPPPRESRR